MKEVPKRQVANMLHAALSSLSRLLRGRDHRKTEQAAATTKIQDTEGRVSLVKSQIERAIAVVEEHVEQPYLLGMLRELPPDEAIIIIIVKADYLAVIPILGKLFTSIAQGLQEQGIVESIPEGVLLIMRDLSGELAAKGVFDNSD